MPRSGPYRRRKGRDTWHYCQNCSRCPDKEGEDDERSTQSEFCDDCKAKERKGNCL
jgi:hypothetical protein